MAEWRPSPLSGLVERAVLMLVLSVIEEIKHVHREMREGMNEMKAK